MKYTGKKQITDRVLAVVLSLLIILATIPIRVQSVEAATETYPDDYTVTVVKDKDLSTEEPIEGASVWYTVEVSQDGGVTWDMTVEESVTPDETDASGTVVISGVASEEGDFVADQTQVKIIYRISKDGYDEYSNELSPTILTDVTHLENDEKVELTEAPLKDLVEGTDYTISGLTSDYDGTAHPVVVTADECIVSYSEDGGTNWSGVAPTITDAGSKTIKIRIEKIGYNTLELDVTLTVNKVDRDDFAFATPSPTDIEYATDLTYSNVATSSREPQAVTYGSSDTTIATVNSTTGLVTFLEAGTVTITASMLGSDNYYASTAEYIITATPMIRPDLYFETSVPSAITYSSGLTFSNNAVDDVSDGTILYSIVSQRRDDLDVNDVATIDSNTGVLSINASGVVIVKAEVTGGSYYRDDEAEYSLTINRATQTGFAFATPSPAPLPYKSSIQNVASGGQGTGEITYVINQAYPIIEFEEDGDNNGKIKAIGIGNASVYATKAADTRYLEVTKYYNITTIKADQTTFVLSPSGAQTVNYGTQTYQLNVSGGESTGIVSYAVVGSSDVGNVDQTGLVTFKDNKKGTLEIVATKHGDNYYNAVQSTIIFTVVSNVSDQFSISGNSLNPGWYIGTVTVSPTSPMTRIGYSGAFFSEWLYNLQFVNEGTYSDVTFYLQHSDKSIYGPNTLPSFRIDKTNPETPVVSYSTAILDTVLETISFGFYDAPVTVTVTSSDETSGIDHFGYNLKKGNGDVIIPEVIIPKESITFDGRNATATFTIDPQYKGGLVVTAYDEAGRHSSTNEDKVLVVDNVAPGVTVTFDNNSAINTNYYKAKRKATIEIVEENFYPEDVVITVGKRLNNETVYTESRIEPDFTKEDDTHVATVLFDEDADYTFDIKYTDKSENAYDDYVKDEFTIDRTSPVLTMTGVNPNQYYSTAQTVKLTVNEHNFNAADFIFKISGVDVQGNVVQITEDYTSFLTTPENWSRNGDEHTAQIELTADATYTMDMYYEDLAGNPARDIEGVELACIDGVAPADLLIEYSASVLDTILETVSFGFYKADAVVTLSASDSTSGVGSFTYSYLVSDGVSPTNVGVENGILQGTDISYSDGGREATATFAIPAQFRGTVSFSATDRSGNTSAVNSDSKVIVVDNVAPGINVAYDNNSAQNGNYYQGDRTATLSITEANFFSGDLDEGRLVITVGKRRNNETVYTETNVKPVFSKNGDVYVGTVVFNEDADYTFDIKYTDHSGNVFDSYAKDEFTVDKTKPSIAVAYDNNAALNGDRFKANRTATVTIEEHNFDPSDVNVSVIATDAAGKSVSVTDYAGFSKKAANWTGTGDVHTLTLVFDQEANYSFSIKYNDLAGNENTAVNTGTSVAPNVFTIDKTAPTASVQVGTWSKSQDGTVWDHFLENVSFVLWHNDTVTVTVNNDDSLSGIDTVDYFRTNNPMSLDAVKAHTEWTRADSTERSYSFNVDPDERFVVYIHVVDKAGNELYLSSDGIIIDKTLPEVEKVAPEIYVQPSQPQNDIFNTDVKIDVRVKDPAGQNDITLYSGLNTVRYEVYNNAVSSTVPTQSGVLFDKADTTLAKDAYGLIQNYEANECIIVDKTKNNSNEVFVKIIATDNSGNTNTETCPLKIDITAPVMNISYNNNSADNGTFFKADRTAVIVVTERNFKPEDMKISIKNSDGVIPTVSAWVTSPGTGNLDNTTWTATIGYSADGDYEFSVSYADKAGNPCPGEVYAAGTVAAQTFTIDKTVPTIRVSYNNDSAMNGNYYKASRTATIVITEHNFSPERTNVTVRASNNERDVTAPTVSAWSTYGDTHTATVVYDKDALYGFDITVQDKAGNDSAEYPEESFYIDKTAPTLKISGVVNNSANSGDVAPLVSYFDQNFDPDQVSISLVGVNRKGVTPDGEYEEDENGGSFTFGNFPKEKETDDIYTLTATLTDKAGNTSTETIQFSVNRFGSTYEISEDTSKLIGSYVQDPIDLIISEINVNALKNIVITLFKNDQTITLTEGIDYKIDVTGGNGQWYQYTYTIFSSNFEEDGVYQVTLYSKDAAGNEAENTLDTKNSDLRFVIDKTAPNIVVTNLESRKTYPVDLLTVLMSANDNLLLRSLTVYMDDYDQPFRTWSEEELAQILAGTGEFTFDIAGDSTKAHKLKVVCVDAAGNEKVEEIEDFYVTTDLFVRYYNNKPLFFGSIAGATLLAALGVFMVVWMKRKNRGM